MAGKYKIYKKHDILHILKNKFTIINLKEEYTTKDTLELICHTCEIKFTKKIGNRLNKECRNCNMKKSKHEKLENKMKEFPEIISWRKGIAYTLVTFYCPECNEKSEKIFVNFKKNKICSKCASKEAADKLDRSKNIESIKILLESYNIRYKPFDKYTGYDDIEVECSICNKFSMSKIYTIKNKCRRDGRFICKHCTLKRKQETSAYNMVKFYENNKELGQQIGYLYFYDIKVDGVVFCKMGITRNNILSRISKVSKIYDISNVRYIEDINLNVSTKERELKNKYKYFKITPEIKFEGYTECFTVFIDIEENMEVQRLSLNGSTTQANGVGSG